MKYLLLLLAFSAQSQCLTMTTWIGSGWTNGAPNVTTIARIDAPYVITGIAPFVNFDCCELVVNSDLEIQNNRFVTVQRDINVNGNLTVKSGGKLIQYTETPFNWGVITVDRETTPLKIYDYTYWSFPVSCTIASSSLGDWFHPRTVNLTTANWYDIEETYNGNFVSNNPDSQDDDGDAWNEVAQTYTPQPSEGIASMVNPTWIFPTTKTVSFTGAPNAGLITRPLQLSLNASVNNDDWNFTGNPYPAPILADSFIIENIPNITGTLAYWTHQGTLSASYPGLAQLNFLASDYAYYNLSGGTAAIFGGTAPTPFIASCQGFMVEAQTTADLVFKPSFMAAGYPNNGFYRLSDPKKIKLDLYNGTHELFSQVLINYDDNTTLDFDYGYDSEITSAKVPVKLYSIETDKFNIQARGSFNQSDVVKLGYYSAVNEYLTIDKHSLEGIESAWIKDNGIIYELPYTFLADIGYSDTRFELIFDDSLSTNQFINYKDYDYELYDMMGRKVSKDVSTNGIYIVRILENNYSFKIVR